MSTTVELNTGAKMPIIGLGTWQSKPGEVENAVKEAINAGYRHLDCAYIYRNENEVGAALKTVFAEGAVKREDLFVTSKLWNMYHHPEDVKPSILKSLEMLGLAYLDLYLVHWPVAFGKTDDPTKIFAQDDKGMPIYDDIDYLTTWKAMEALVDEGLVKAIGVSNFSLEQIDRLLENSRIKPAVNQVELHPYLAQTKLVKHCQDNGIVVEAYSPLGSPARPWLEKCSKAVPRLLDDPKVVALAKKHGKSPGQILIRYTIERGVVVLPKSVSPDRIKGNLQIFDFSLTQDDMASLNSLDINSRYIVPVIMNSEGQAVTRDAKAKYYPFNLDGSKVLA